MTRTPSPFHCAGIKPLAGLSSPLLTADTGRRRDYYVGVYGEPEVHEAYYASLI